MTGNESELIERLIVEATKRGATERELLSAVETAEYAAKTLEAERVATRKLSEQVQRLTARADEAEGPLAAFYSAAERVMLEINNPSKRMRQERIDAAVNALGRTREAAAIYCGEVPF